jgi:hypothetical protein
MPLKSCLQRHGPAEEGARHSPRIWSEKTREKEKGICANGKGRWKKWKILAAGGTVKIKTGRFWEFIFGISVLESGKRMNDL